MRVSFAGAAFIVAVAVASTASGVRAAVVAPTLNVLVFGGSATARINGIPFAQERQGGAVVERLPGGGSSTNESPVTLASTVYQFFCRNGDNEIGVDADITAPHGSVEMILQGPQGPLFDQKLTKSGSIAHVVTLSGLPAWNWTAADAVTDDAPGLLDAVAQLQQAFSAKDAAQVVALEARFFDNLRMAGTQIPSGAALEQVFADHLKSESLAPLPGAADLTVKSYAGGRIFSVTDASGHAPVLLRDPHSPEHPDEFGKFWSRIEGRWYVTIEN
ncbi:MAG: hypothetical protein WAJ85_06090 [Candidatus Baltobacteraceae bacterium]|jgi:hypothetical protein